MVNKIYYLQSASANSLQFCAGGDYVLPNTGFFGEKRQSSWHMKMPWGLPPETGEKDEKNGRYQCIRPCGSMRGG